MATLDLDALCTALSDAEPSGPNLEYDADFLALETEAKGTPERQAGDEVLPAQPPQWVTVLPKALSLAARTRDLRVACLVTRAAAATQGLAGYVQGLKLINTLLVEQWDSVHPELDHDDHDDPTMRLSALAPLADHDVGLVELRACTLGGKHLPLTVRQLEVAFGAAEAHEGESVPTRGGVSDALVELKAQGHEVATTLRDVRQQWQTLERLLDDKLGSANTLDAKPMLRLAGALQQAADACEGITSAEGSEAAEGAGGAEATRGGRTRATGSGDIASRADVDRTITRLCEWIEANEPSNPAPLLLRRAQRLMSKSFMDIVRDLAPESLSQVERIAGTVEPT
jgi:type VI secretion system protein ImpA